MPSMADLQKMQEQLGGGMPGMPGMPGAGKMPPGMEGLDLNNVDFSQAMKNLGKKGK